MTTEIVMDSNGLVTDIRDVKPSPGTRRAALISKILIFGWILFAIAGFVCFLGDMCSR